MRRVAKRSRRKTAPAPRISEVEILHRVVHVANSGSGLAEVLSEILHLVDEVSGADASLLYLVEGREPGRPSALVLAASRPPHPEEVDRIRLGEGEGITGWVAAHRRPVAVAERAYEDTRFKPFQSLPEDRFEAFLSVPILRGDDLVGVLNVQHRSRFRHPPALVRLLASIGRQVAGIIERERLLDETRRRAQAIEALSGAAGAITSDRYLDEILERIVRMTADRLGFKICSVMLLDEAKRELRIAATQSLSSAYRSKPAIPVEGTLSGRTVLERRPLAYRDVRAETAFRFPEIARQEGLVSLLSVPMICGREIIGVINAYTASEQDFAPEETTTLQAVADQCAAAIRHARALQRALEAQEALETRKAVERAKAALMRARGMTEEEAHREIQRRSMDHRKGIRDVAEAILLVEGDRRD